MIAAARRSSWRIWRGFGIRSKRYGASQTNINSGEEQRLTYALADPPQGPFPPEASIHAVASAARLLPAGATVAGWDSFLPQELYALVMAH
jgi:hypothetical protein